jgi:hypothetical protein
MKPVVKARSFKILANTIFFEILGFELRAYTLSRSTSPLLWWFFQDRVPWTICLELALNHNPPEFSQGLSSIILTTMETELWRILVRGQPRQKFARPHLQNNKSKMDWRCGLSNQPIALQVGTTEFKPQSPPKKKKTVIDYQIFSMY